MPSTRSYAKLRPMLGQEPFSYCAFWQWIAPWVRTGFGVFDQFRLSAPVEGFLEDGDRLPGAPDWEVILAPGHSACSACFWNRRTRTLISGDAVLTLRGRAWFNPVLIDEAAMDRTAANPGEHHTRGGGRRRLNALLLDVKARL